MATLSICWNPLRNIGSYVRAENLVGCGHPQQRRSTATRTANHPPGGSAKPLIAGFPHISTMRVHAGMGEVRWMNGFYARRWIVGKKRIHRGERAKKEAWCVEKRTMERKRVCTAEWGTRWVIELGERMSGHQAIQSENQPVACTNHREKETLRFKCAGDPHEAGASRKSPSQFYKIPLTPKKLFLVVVPARKKHQKAYYV